VPTQAIDVDVVDGVRESGAKTIFFEIFKFKYWY